MRIFGFFSGAAQGCLLVIGLTACTTDRVVVDKRGLDQARYEKDLAECRDYKQQVPVGEEMAKGAAVGAAVGGLLGATAGVSGRNSHNRGDNVVDGAAVGAVYGATDKMIDTSEEKARIVKNCLRGRGYRVLN